MDDSYAAASAGLGISFAIQLIIMVGVYVWLSLAIMAIFKKTGSAPWKAWIPVVREWQLFTLVRMNPVWAILWYAVPLIYSVILSILIGVLFATVLNSAMGGGSGGIGWIILIMVLLGLAYLAFSVFLIIMVVKMIHRLNLGFGYGTGYTVLGFFLFPVWASIVGWGANGWNPAAVPANSRNRGGDGGASMLHEQGAAPQAPAGVRYAPPAAPSGTPAPQQPAPAGAASAVPPAPPAVSTPVAPAPAAPQTRPAPPVEPVSLSGDGHPWAPPEPAAPVTPAPATPAPVPPTQPVAETLFAPPAESPQEAVPVSEPVDDQTVLASRSRSLGELVLPGGDTVSLTSDTVLIGRNPVAEHDGANVQLITVPDGTRTISKTHARLSRASGVWTITDLNSTNGVVFVDDAGVETEISGEETVSGTFFLGDAEFTLRNNG